MKNILNYLKTNTKSFIESPLNCVDAVILCWLSYFRYPFYVKSGKAVTPNEMIKTGMLPEEETFAMAFNPKSSRKLFRLVAASPRFSGIKLCSYREETDEKTEKQFAAICMRITKGSYFIAFRGTDPSYVGWKEDLNQAYRYPVPSQISAYNYTVERMLRKPRARFYLGGHSKGGNMAVYSAFNADKELQKRIISVYNFDGPEFLDDVYKSEGYKNVSEKLIKIIPQSSFIGTLLDTRHVYRVIRSNGVSFLQHDPFSWVVEDGDFVTVDCRSKGAIRLEKAVNLWISEMPKKERERIIEMFYGALNALDVKDFNSFFRTFYRQLPALWGHYKKLETNDRAFFGDKIKRLHSLLKTQD